MGQTYIEAERTEAALPLELVVNRAGGVTGLTVVVAIRDAASLTSWLDFADNTFKAAGWTTRQAALTEVSIGNAPGQYRRVLDLTAITNLPAAPARLVAEYDVSGTEVANASDVIMLKTTAFVPAVAGDAMDLVANAVDAAAIATDAIDADAIAAGAIGAAEAPLLDVAVSSRSSHSAADVDTTLTAAHGAGAWTTADLTGVLAAIAALNDLSIADVQTAMTNQGYTSARALLLDNLDQSISSIATAIAALNDLSQADVQAAMTAQGYTAARALLLDNLDATISSVLAAIAALNDPTAGAIADAVWTEVLAAHETTSGSAAEALAVLRNRIRVDFTVGPPRELVVYDQAGTTELYRAPLTTTNGTEVLAFFGVQHERGVPV